MSFEDQMEMFPPAARSTDPETSREADAAHTASGRRARDCEAMLKLVGKFPARTAREHAYALIVSELKAAGVEKPLDLAETVIRLSEMPHKRLSDLRGKQLVVVSEERECTISKRKAAAWRLP